MKKRHKNEDLDDFQARRKKCNAKRRAKDKTRGQSTVKNILLTSIKNNKGEI